MGSFLLFDLVDIDWSENYNNIARRVSGVRYAMPILGE